MKKAVINPYLCRRCLRCLSACRFGAIGLSFGTLRVDFERCKGCGICQEACFFGAISLVDVDREANLGYLKQGVALLKDYAESLLKKIDSLEKKLFAKRR